MSTGIGANDELLRMRQDYDLHNGIYPKGTEKTRPLHIMKSCKGLVGATYQPIISFFHTTA